MIRLGIFLGITWLRSAFANRRVGQIVLALFLLHQLDPSISGQTRRLDTTTFIVMGEGLAAGFSNFSLSEEVQRGSFPALMARQMGAMLPQPVFRAPGVGNAPGFGDLPVGIPKTLQTTVRTQSPPTLFVFNLSIPGFTAADALSRRPVDPLILESDPKQTLVNMVLGYPMLILEAGLPRWTQLEYALEMHPTVTLVALGFSEVLEASVETDLRKLPNPGEFGSNLEQIVTELRNIYSEVVILTIPDPLSTAYFSALPEAESFLGVPPGTLRALYGLPEDALLTIPGLVEVGHQLISGKLETLPNRSSLPGQLAAEVSAAVNAMNQEIRSLAFRHQAVLFDLHALYQTVDESGLIVADRTITGGYMGGFFLLNGYYPGLTGHALIANELLQLLNLEYGTRFAGVNLELVLEHDSAANYWIGDREPYSIEDLEKFASRGAVDRLRGARARRSSGLSVDRKPIAVRRKW